MRHSERATMGVKLLPWAAALFATQLALPVVSVLDLGGDVVPVHWIAVALHRHG